LGLIPRPPNDASKLLWGFGRKLTTRQFPLRGEKPSSVLYRETNGKIKNYAVYDKEGNISKRIDLDQPTAHYGVTENHVHEYTVNRAPDGTAYPRETSTRDATPNEIPSSDTMEGIRDQVQSEVATQNIAQAGISNPPEGVEQFFYDQASIDVSFGAGSGNPNAEQTLIGDLEGDD
jgi:hypothetical protein